MSKGVGALIALCLLVPLTAMPKGIFKLMPVQGGAQGKTVTITTADFSLLASGLAVRQAWEDLELVQGSPNWSFFDNAVACAQAANQKVALSLIAGATSPPWLNPIVKLLTLTGNDAKRGATMPAPWDPVYLSHWTQIIAEFGARYNGNPYVAYVTATGMGQAEECYLLDDPGDISQWDFGDWNVACETIIGAYAQAFTVTAFVVTWGKPVAMPGWDSIMQNVYYLNYNFGFKADALSSTFPNLSTTEGQTALNVMAEAGYPVVMQEVSAQGANLAAALANGAALGATAFEVYPADIVFGNASILAKYL